MLPGVTQAPDPVAHNRAAWDREVDTDNEWTRPVGPDVIARARAGAWSVVLIGYEPVPRDWFPASLAGADVLCLASGGGQQGPVLAAAGATVTVLDNSPRQLGRDEEVAAREGLAIRTVLGDMRDLSALADASFDVVFNPVSNVFCPDLAPVWRESFRVLRPGGVLIGSDSLASNDLHHFHADDTYNPVDPAWLLGRLQTLGFGALTIEVDDVLKFVATKPASPACSTPAAPGTAEDCQ